MPITKRNDAIVVNQVAILIYGEPGAGKTSTACTASKALVLDFDKGIHRSAYRTDALRPETWSEVTELLRDKTALAEYDTIVIDTVGRCLDYILYHLKQTNPKVATSAGNPTMQGWGEIKATFTRFIRDLQTSGKDVIMIAHEREKEEGDVTRLRPDVSGGSYGEIFKVADFVGRQYMTGDKRTLNFAPSDRSIGKNSANLPIMSIPSFEEAPDYFNTIIANMKSALSRGATEQKQAVNDVDTIRDAITATTNIEQLSAQLALAKQRTPKLSKAVLLQVKAIADEHAKTTLNAKWDADKKSYVLITPPAPKEPTPVPVEDNEMDW